MAEQGRTLATTVYVGGQAYRAGTVPPEDIAKRITNPKAWETAEGDDAERDSVMTTSVISGETGQPRKATRKSADS